MHILWAMCDSLSCPRTFCMLEIEQLTFQMVDNHFIFWATTTSEVLKVPDICERWCVEVGLNTSAFTWKTPIFYRKRPTSRARPKNIVFAQILTMHGHFPTNKTEFKRKNVNFINSFYNIQLWVIWISAAMLHCCVSGWLLWCCRQNLQKWKDIYFWYFFLIWMRDWICCNPALSLSEMMCYFVSGL